MCIITTEYASSVKRDISSVVQAPTWTQLTCTVKRERSQSQKSTYYTIPF